MRYIIYLVIFAVALVVTIGLTLAAGLLISDYILLSAVSGVTGIAAGLTAVELARRLTQ